jgi:signal transduction histidine kinase
MEREARIREVAAKTSKLSETEAYVTDLENERELREKFVSLLTHDLRTPLSAAKISAQLIQRQGEISEMSQALAARIVTNVARADQMITDLLDANRIRGGEKLPLHPEHVELNSLIKETLQELATIHGDRFVLKNDQVVNGYWDRKSLMRIVENLCNNAVKYGCPQSPITICLTSHDDFAIISVQNFGDLISSTDQKTLFRQFRRTQSAHGSRKKGWGIGLTLVRGVAEAHGGSVALASEKEAGTIFTVSLPLDSRPFLQKEVK